MRRLVLLALLAACSSSPSSSTAPAGENRPRSEPIESVGLAVTVPFAETADAVRFLDRLFGNAAASGDRHTDTELQSGLRLTSYPDDRTPEQAVIVLEMETMARDPRTILQVPASYAYGRVLVDAADVAFRRADAIEAEAAGSMEPFVLEYRAWSPNGGVLTVRARFEASQKTIELDTTTPETSLRPATLNSPAFAGEPWETLGGTVWFTLSRDEFDFFSTRAYGLSAGAAQNFDDFRLLPHDWLRLTVTPQLEEERVDVAFEVLTTDGRRVPFARAPASLVAGEQFRENVFRMVGNMNAIERETPGQSAAWRVPFYYDDPEGGGVVSVIAQGQGGVFRIAYAVEAPRKRLRDVSFLPYQGVVEVPDTLEPPRRSCADVGSEPALRGQFRVRFDASTTVRESDALTNPLRGPIWGDVFRAEDVTLSGPREGAEPLGSFQFEDVDATVAGEGMVYAIDLDLPVGEYQLLGFMDIDGNADPDAPRPDEGDPVTLPIGGYPLECAEQPIVVEFALLLPPGR
ncbi:MAG: hypothetical protein H6721_20335 [Sandaracinus sp.]|nr:hypothetical protein [Sandaracinus sp.]MCB9623702.1 hypothetical protein [Sandaracinus sp.]MCB9634478.1 hypothetical protein [Sandaracinus sp.]